MARSRMSPSEKEEMKALRLENQRLHSVIERAEARADILLRLFGADPMTTRPALADKEMEG